MNFQAAPNPRCYSFSQSCTVLSQVKVEMDLFGLVIGSEIHSLITDKINIYIHTYNKESKSKHKEEDSLLQK